MNKHEIKKGLFCQNVYNLLNKNHEYKSYTCYFDADYNLLYVFNASKVHNLISMIPDDSLIPLNLDNDTLNLIKEVLESWTYSHLQPIIYPCKYDFWQLSERDNFVIAELEKH